ncbi:MAG: aminopeptidase P family protein [Bacteroidales bacterium]|nr:aminopeptidase P family protein [Bacteroidales bacterium]
MSEKVNDSNVAVVNRAERISSVREMMKQQGIDALLVTDADPYLSEYPANCWKERSWLSGFTGSNGVFVVTCDKLLLWTDSRYRLQADIQMRGVQTDIFISNDFDDVSHWLRDNLVPGATVAFRGECFSASRIEKMESKLTGFSFKSADMLSALWHERPKRSSMPFFVFDDKFAGCNAMQKMQLVRSEMTENKVSALLLTALDEVAWLLNVRGTDVAYNPVAEGFLLLTEKKTALFCNEKKCTADLMRYFSALDVEVHAESELKSALERHDGAFWADMNVLNHDLYRLLRGKLIKKGHTPVCVCKAIKNKTEIAGIENACVKDGVAMVRFNVWLENALEAGERLTEILLAEKLRSYRAEQTDFCGESFAPIVAYADHAAIVHYSATSETDAVLRPSGFLLIDSGGQYSDGTTDITRTFVLGELTELQRLDYTLVLKGNVALASAIFPEKTTGAHLDVLARQFLWKNALDYGHGTGHGIGHFLNVHEGPQSIRRDQNAVEIKPGMLISDEPGVYRPREYGVRLENMILAENHTKSDFGSFFKFRTLTLFPFEKRAIIISMLSPEEQKWLDDYHAEVYNKLSPYLSENERGWLAERCRWKKQ